MVATREGKMAHRLGNVLFWLGTGLWPVFVIFGVWAANAAGSYEPILTVTIFGGFGMLCWGFGLAFRYILQER